MDPKNAPEAAQSAAKADTTKIETPKPSTAREIPNGGFEAWTQVVGSFILFFNGW
jgi:hypothetical protein